MTEQMNVPKLRFGEFDGIWLSDRVGNIFDIKAGGDIDKENVSDVRNEKFPYPVFANAEKKKGLYGYSDLYKVDPPCLTVAGRGVNIGIAHARFERFYPIVRLLTLKPKKEQDVKFHEYVFNRLNIFVESTGVPQLTGPQISSYRVALPAYPEQQKIASFLTKVDEKIALLTEKQNKLTEYKKGVMQQLFNGKWKEQDGQLIFIPPTLRFKADDGSEFPDWEEKKLGSLADLTSSKRVYLSDYSEDGVPFFRGKEISEIRKGIIPDDVLYITRKAFEEFKSKYGAPVEGDILVTAVGTLANILRVTGEFEFYFKDGNLIWLRKPRCDSKFLSILMEANKHELLKTAIGSSQKALTIVELKKIVFKMPSLEEQQKITMFLSSLEEKVRLANSELEKAKEWKKGLLQQMFV
ncbi:hypothetical protein BBM62_01835 [Vibrio parahaemolyticus]|uniref:restriction endonuclease subunit S n=1 Tax=Vibrio parahaemolyticus TaxID=670 RepID=UPI00084A5D3B|nr:restriction endonuclease subunit S [Vibrio parahaemolyticus]EJD0685023.1 restriction endonuclease subunit S [Vibrio parahaemolyticus]EJI6219842.1 restriction endonuclease subunit S [Vibrio parahaemolyticus]OEA50546.1 hypothetical protein BBM62_01835 [Vibrio parahaemolyticus]